MVIPRRFKHVCAACGAVGAKVNKEHFWPEWLIERTGTHRTGVALVPGKRVNPRKFTVPLCVTCNTDFGRELEDPVSRLFRRLENGEGLSDVDAELLVRWLWKFEGLVWIFTHPDGRYTQRYSLRDRVLNPIDDIRENLVLAVSLVGTINPGFGDAPMGLDSWNEESGVFVAGVFSRVAVMVLLHEFEDDVSSHFSLYRLAKRDAPDRAGKLFYPKIGFVDCVEAVRITRETAMYLSHAHDLDARNRIDSLGEV